jgi:bifunctional non-homologous end joining protein LigD
VTETVVDGRTLALSNLDRILWPSTGFTKRDLVGYYAAVGAAMTPHLRGRPVMRARFPEGIGRPGWGQWECRGRPDWVSTTTLRMRDGREVETCVIDDVASLVWAANQGTIEFHPYLARAGALDTPTSVVFDLDPGPPATIVDCATVALRLRTVLDDVGLRAVVKSSGGDGLHVFVPLNTPVTYAQTKSFARGLAARLTHETPDLVVNRMAKSAREGRVFIDWGQNDARKQTVAAYSLRTTREPIASAPLTWDEVAGAVANGDPRPLIHGPEAVIRRLDRLGDPFADAADAAQGLPPDPYPA